MHAFESHDFVVLQNSRDVFYKRVAFVLGCVQPFYCGWSEIFVSGGGGVFLKVQVRVAVWSRAGLTPLQPVSLVCRFQIMIFSTIFNPRWCRVYSSPKSHAFELFCGHGDWYSIWFQADTGAGDEAGGDGDTAQAPSDCV